MRNKPIAAMLIAGLVIVNFATGTVVAEEVDNGTPRPCLLISGVSWLPVEWLPEGLQEQVTDQTPTQTIKGVKFIRIKQFVEAHGGTVGWDGAAGLVMLEFEEQVIPLKALHSESFWQAQKGGPKATPSIAIGQIPSRPCYKDDCGLYWVTPELLPKPLQEEVTDNTPGATYDGVFTVSLEHFAQDHGAQFQEGEQSVSVTFEGGTTAYMPLDLNTFLWQVGKRPEYRPPPRKPGRKGRTGEFAPAGGMPATPSSRARVAAASVCEARARLLLDAMKYPWGDPRHPNTDPIIHPLVFQGQNRMTLQFPHDLADYEVLTCRVYPTPFYNSFTGMAEQAEVEFRAKMYTKGGFEVHKRGSIMLGYYNGEWLITRWDFSD